MLLGQDPHKDYHLLRTKSFSKDCERDTSSSNLGKCEERKGLYIGDENSTDMPKVSQEVNQDANVSCRTLIQFRNFDPLHRKVHKNNLLRMSLLFLSKINVLNDLLEGNNPAAF